MPAPALEAKRTNPISYDPAKREATLPERGLDSSTCRRCSSNILPPGHDDPDLPEWTDEMCQVAEYAIGGKVIRQATGYLGPNGVVGGRPPVRGRTKRQVTLRLDPDVIDRFRADGPGRQGRMNEALRKAVGLQGRRSRTAPVGASK